MCLLSPVNRTLSTKKEVGGFCCEAPREAKRSFVRHLKGGPGLYARKKNGRLLLRGAARAPPDFV